MLRDIREDLLQRLSSIEAEREELQRKLQKLNDRARSIEVLLEAESARFRSLHLTDTNGISPLAQIIREALSAHRVRSTIQLTNLAKAKGFPFGEKSPNRVVHFALVGMTRNDIVRKTATGDWELVPDDHEKEGDEIFG